MPYYKGGYNAQALMCNQMLIYPPNTLKALAKTASFAILSFVLPGRWGTTSLRRGTTSLRHYRSSGKALSQFSYGTAATKLTVGSKGYLYPFSSSPTALLNLLLIPARQKQKRIALSLSPSLTIGAPQASLFDSLPNPREFEPPNCIREQPQLFFNCQSTWFTFKPVDCVCYS